MNDYPRHLPQRRIASLAPLFLSACTGAVPGAAAAPQVPDPVILSGLIVVGPEGPSSEPMDLALADGLITEIVPTGSRDWGESERIELNAHWATPAFVDSHVHLTYLSVASEMADGGVAAAVDLAAPQTSLQADFNVLDMVQSGPMITPIGGYPTQSWGSNGYGLECADSDAVEAAIRQLASEGAGVVKLPIGLGVELSDDQLTRAVAIADELGLPTVSHATSEAGAARAAAAGVDALAHMPTEALSDKTIQMWSTEAVIPTLRAFGGSSTTLENLRRLHEAGTTVLYGTDMGNLRTPGIVEVELLAMVSAGMSPLEVIGAGTWEPAEWWGLEPLGLLEAGRQASLIITDVNPIEEISALSQPTQVWIDGVRREGSR